MAVTLVTDRAPRRKVGDRHHRGASRWIVLALVTLAALAMLVPFVFMLLNAFKSPGDYSSSGPLSWPSEFYTKGLTTYWTEVDFPLKFWNSLLISGSVAVLAVAVSLFNAYALGIGKVKGRLWIVGLFLLANMMPQEALIYPLYYAAKQIGLYNTQLSVIIIFTVVQSAFGTYLLASVLGTFPAPCSKPRRWTARASGRCCGGSCSPTCGRPSRCC
ncbi:carbohydrate ABC transporter permease [Catellatospora coxensis]